MILTTAQPFLDFGAHSVGSFDVAASGYIRSASECGGFHARLVRRFLGSFSERLLEDALGAEHICADTVFRDAHHIRLSRFLDLALLFWSAECVRLCRTRLSTCSGEW